MLGRLSSATIGITAVCAIMLGGFTIIDNIEAHRSTTISNVELASATTHGVTRHVRLSGSHRRSGSWRHH